MTDGKPLNVQVAEALGFKVRDDSRECRDACVVSIPEGGYYPVAMPTPHKHGGWVWYKSYDWDDYGDWIPVSRYDTDWSVTGPVIEKYGITVGINACNGKWKATTERLGDSETTPAHSADYHETPLLAACNLILGLKQAGRI